MGRIVNTLLAGGLTLALTPGCEAKGDSQPEPTRATTTERCWGHEAADRVRSLGEQVVFLARRTVQKRATPQPTRTGPTDPNNVAFYLTQRGGVTALVNTQTERRRPDGSLDTSTTTRLAFGVITLEGARDITLRVESGVQSNYCSVADAAISAVWNGLGGETTTIANGQITGAQPKPVESRSQAEVQAQTRRAIDNALRQAENFTRDLTLGTMPSPPTNPSYPS